MALSLTLTYNALRQGRSESLHARIHGLLRVVAQGSDASTRNRVMALKGFASDTAILRALSSPDAPRSPAAESAVVAALNKVAIATDSGLPIELWTKDGHRLASVGKDVRGDSISALPPELRSLRGTPVSAATTSNGSDSVQFGALYQSSGRVYFWVIVPVMKDSQRIGYIAQQRRLVPNPTIKRTINDLSGEQFDWRIGPNYVQLNPWTRQAHVLKVHA